MASLFNKRKSLRINKGIAPIKDVVEDNSESIYVELNSGILTTNSKDYYDSFGGKCKIERSKTLMKRLPTAIKTVEFESKTINFDPKFHYVRVSLGNEQFVNFYSKKELTTQAILDFIRSALLTALDSTIQHKRVDFPILSKLDQDNYMNTVVKSCVLRYKKCAENTSRQDKHDLLIIDNIKYVDNHISCAT